MTDRELLEKDEMFLVQLVDCLSDTLEHLDTLREEIHDHLKTEPVKTLQQIAQEKPT